MLDYFINDKTLVVKQIGEYEPYDLLELDRFIIRNESLIKDIKLIKCNSSIIEYINTLGINWSVYVSS